MTLKNIFSTLFSAAAPLSLTVFVAAAQEPVIYP